jgi:FKBP-type peptidyl-prolyl cis-trans isomerase
MRHLLLPSFVALSLLGGCLDSSGPQTTPCDTVLLTFGPAPGDTVALANGLKVQTHRLGTGATAINGNTISIHYTGYLVSGARFDSSCFTQLPYRFQLGAGSVIAGFDQGIAGMKVGGVRRLIIPPSLGYGASANGSIPANSTLIFDVELLGVN